VSNLYTYSELFGNLTDGLDPVGGGRYWASGPNDQGQAADRLENRIVRYRPADGSTETLADTDGLFASFDFPIAINNRGEVAFGARRDDMVTGVFAGPDPVNDVVLRSGQPLFGQTVGNVRVGNKAINDRGQLAMVVEFTNLTRAIIVADPLPGDIDMDCEVGIGDLTILLAHFGSTTYDYFEGDIVQNQVVDIHDLTLLLSQYGLACP
jgi:hypothetical protein